MSQIRKFIIILLSFFISFGVWYLFLWFITNQPNLFLWEWWIKLIYLIFGYNTWNNLVEKQEEEL
jgi:hypothetical protein